MAGAGRSPKAPGRRFGRRRPIGHSKAFASFPRRFWRLRAPILAAWPGGLAAPTRADMWLMC